jgi:hypothetical protein
MLSLPKHDDRAQGGCAVRIDRLRQRDQLMRLADEGAQFGAEFGRLARIAAMDEPVLVAEGRAALAALLYRAGVKK